MKMLGTTAMSDRLAPKSPTHPFTDGCEDLLRNLLCPLQNEGGEPCLKNQEFQDSTCTGRTRRGQHMAPHLLPSTPDLTSEEVGSHVQHLHSI